MTLGSAQGPHQTRQRPRIGFGLTHRRYVDHSLAHYSDGLVSGAFLVAMFNDIATDVCIQVDHDEGLFASYSEINFLESVRVGDVVEVSAEVVRVGNRSRTLEFTAVVASRALTESDTGSGVLVEPIRAASAVGTVVVPSAFGSSIDQTDG